MYRKWFWQARCTVERRRLQAVSGEFQIIRTNYVFHLFPFLLWWMRSVSVRFQNYPESQALGWESAIDDSYLEIMPSNEVSGPVKEAGGPPQGRTRQPPGRNQTQMLVTSLATVNETGNSHPQAGCGEGAKFQFSNVICTFNACYFLLMRCSFLGSL